jgi:hypothetical protein
MSENIVPSNFAAPAELIRKQIQEVIHGDVDEQKSGKADGLPTKIKGGAIYGGDVLARKFSELIHEMKIGDVRDVPHGLISFLTRT